MVTLQELQARRELLAAARSTGTRAVQFPDGSRVEYRTDAEMAAALTFLEREMAAAQGISRPSRFYFNTSKGL